MPALDRRHFLAGLSTLALAGCESMSGLNPFEEKKTPLPGERRSVFDQSQAPKTEGAKVSISAARSGDWPQPGGDAQNAPGNLALSGTGGWRAGGDRLGSREARAGASPVSSQGRLYVYGAEGVVAAFSVEGGTPLWAADARPEGVSAGSLSGGGVAADGGRVYAATGYRTVAAFDAATGQRLWLRQLPQPMRSAPTVAGGRVFAVSAGNVLYALSAADGKDLWTYTGVPEAAGVVSAASAAVSGNTVIVPFSSGEVVAFDAAKGTQKWTLSMAAGANGSLAGMPEVAARPVVAGGTVYCASVSGRLVAVREANGQRVWERPFGTAHTPAVSGNGLFLVTLSNELIGLDRSSGKVAWAVELPSASRESWAGPTLAGGQLWLASTAGRVISADPVSGKLVGERAAGEGVYLSPIVAAGRLVVVTGGGGAVAV